jgi:hypothetical protein
MARHELTGGIAIKRLTHQRVTQMGQMDPRLVSAAGAKLHEHETVTPSLTQRSYDALTGPAHGCHSKAPWTDLTDGLLNDPGVELRLSVANG